MSYTSHMLGRWSQGFCSAKYLPTKRGFSSFYGTWASGGDHDNHIASADPRSPLSTLGYDFHEDDTTLLGSIRYNKVDLMVERFTEILNKHFKIERGWFSGYPTGRVEYKTGPSIKPFFVMLNFDNLKLPLNPEDRFRQMYRYQKDEKRKQFLASISKLDDAIGKVLSDIRRFYRFDDSEEKELFDDTVIIFSSTSGGLSSGPVTSGSSSSPLRGHQGDMLEGGTKVPAFIANVGAKGRKDSLVHITDWLPTIYAGVAGGNEKDLEDLDGVNQIDVIRGKSEDLRTEILYDIANFNATNYKYTHVTAVDWPENFELTGAFGATLRVGNFKLSIGCNTLLGCTRNYNSTWEGNTSNTRMVLYDISKDPEEKTNLAEEEDYKAKVEEMANRLRWHTERAVKPIHAEFENSGLPLYSFPPGQFFTGWCDDSKYDEYKSVNQTSV